MAKGTIKEGDEVDLRVVQRVWPNGEITIAIKSASAGGRLTLLEDRDINVPRGCAEAFRKAPQACLAGNIVDGLINGNLSGSGSIIAVCRVNSRRRDERRRAF
jgi:hypothetical protein